MKNGKVWITNGINDRDITKLFNASQSTNFIFKIPNWDSNLTEEVNGLLNSRGSADVKGEFKKFWNMATIYSLKALTISFSKIIWLW